MAAWKKARWAALRASAAGPEAEAPPACGAPLESGGMAKNHVLKAGSALIRFANLWLAKG
jgi:hypothetical protein